MLGLNFHIKLFTFSHTVDGEKILNITVFFKLFIVNCSIKTGSKCLRISLVIFMQQNYKEANLPLKKPP